MYIIIKEIKLSKRCMSTFSMRYMSTINNKNIINFNDNEIKEFNKNGFICKANVIPKDICDKIGERIPKLFQGDFPTGVYPDEWHWRQGISLPNVTKEICNAWKCDQYLASVILSTRIGRLCSQLGNWNAARIGQDDIWDKPPKVGKEIAFHQDSSYISCQFIPYVNSSITAWLALEDVSEETGSLEYVQGSHLWERNTIATEFHAPNQHYKTQLEQAAKANNMEGVKSIPINLSKGDIAFHHQDIWHGSGMNKSNRHRLAIGIHLLNANVQFKTDNVGYIYGRYKRINDTTLDESFFPIIFANNDTNSYKRSSWLKDFCEFDLN